VFRCKHPGEAPTPGTQGPYEPCDHSDECEDGLFCHVPGGLSTGYCTLQCDPETADPCGALTAPGPIEPLCKMPFPSTGSSHCVLDCAEKPDGCPGDMTCIEYSMFSRCGYQE
jgi:hypothetical protein